MQENRLTHPANRFKHCRSLSFCASLTVLTRKGVFGATTEFRSPAGDQREFAGDRNSVVAPKALFRVSTVEEAQVEIWRPSWQKSEPSHPIYSVTDQNEVVQIE